MKRTLAIGDVHGCLAPLRRLWEVVAPSPIDHVVFLGDYVDRGPDSKGVVDFVLGRRRDHRVTCLVGNHEEKMVRARDDHAEREEWLALWGGAATLASYGARGFDDVPAEHWAFLEEERLYLETDDHVFVHANLDPDLPLHEQPRLALLRRKLGASRPHRSGKTMICGHTAQKSHRPLNLGHAVCIDTDPDRDGWLTCLHVETGRYWQVGGALEVREGRV